MQHAIRNICIIAHIDHGKSTLADRLIEHGNLLTGNVVKAQMLDSMDIERERGITIKSQAISIQYNDVQINVIDTPGHADFSYEVSRAITSCEGALLLIDATQGVQAQTLSNLYIALEFDVAIIPVINKIDVQSADVERIQGQIQALLGLDAHDAIQISAKQNINIDRLLNAVIHKIPHPSGDAHAPLRARVFDSIYDSFRGVILYIRVVDGVIKSGDLIRGWTGTGEYRVEEVGIFLLKRAAQGALTAGAVGYCIANIKSITDIAVGDTIVNPLQRAAAALPGFRTIKPSIYSAIFPIDNDDQERLRDAVQKLQLNDAAFTFEPELSDTMGVGFRCGFLGLLHLEIIQERLEREFGTSILFTAPSVLYEIVLKNGETRVISSAQQYPDVVQIMHIREPFVAIVIITQSEYIGKIMQLCIRKRAISTSTNYIDQQRVELNFEMPLAEILYDFYDALKSASSGYASFDYTFIDYRVVQLVKVDILIAGNGVDALSTLVHRHAVEYRTRMLCKMLKEKIPRHNFPIAIQGAIGKTVLVRETIPAYRKDVTAKLYGGDITRKRKLLEKQKKGKKRLKMIGNVNVPQEAFLAVMQSRAQ